MSVLIVNLANTELCQLDNGFVRKGHSVYIYILTNVPLLFQI